MDWQAPAWLLRLALGSDVVMSWMIMLQYFILFCHGGLSVCRAARSETGVR